MRRGCGSATYFSLSLSFPDNLCRRVHRGWGKSLAHAPLLLFRVRLPARRGTVCDERWSTFLPALLRCHFCRILRLLWRPYRGGPGTDVPWRATLACHWELLPMSCMYGTTARKTLSSPQRTYLLFCSLQQRWLTNSLFIPFLNLLFFFQLFYTLLKNTKFNLCRNYKNSFN